MVFYIVDEFEFFQRDCGRPTDRPRHRPHNTKYTSTLSSIYIFTIGSRTECNVAGASGRQQTFPNKCAADDDQQQYQHKYNAGVALVRDANVGLHWRSVVRRCLWRLLDRWLWWHCCALRGDEVSARALVADGEHKRTNGNAQSEPTNIGSH
jgi:hypothetical protein